MNRPQRRPQTNQQQHRYEIPSMLQAVQKSYQDTKLPLVVSTTEFEFYLIQWNLKCEVYFKSCPIQGNQVVEIIYSKDAIDKHNKAQYLLTIGQIDKMQNYKQVWTQYDCSLFECQSNLVTAISDTASVSSIPKKDVLSYVKSFFGRSDYNVEDIKLTQDSLYQCTSAVAFDEMMQMCLCDIFKSIDRLVIADMNACVGADTIHFAVLDQVKKVVAVENDSEAFAALMHNSKSSDKWKRKILVLKESCLNKVAFSIFQQQSVNCMYFDPPWGGVDYKEKSLNIVLDGVDIFAAINQAARECDQVRYIIVKLPRNYPSKTIPGFVKSEHNLKKMQVIVFRKT